jgi:hypothetical protein
MSMAEQMMTDALAAADRAVVLTAALGLGGELPPPEKAKELLDLARWLGCAAQELERRACGVPAPKGGE